MAYYSIANLQLNIDIPGKLLSEALEDFESAHIPSADGTAFSFCSSVHILLDEDPARNSLLPSQADYMHVEPTPSGYRFTYSAESTLSGCDVNVKAREAVITPKHGCSTDLPEVVEALKSDIFFAVRDVFFLFALREGRVPVHSSSVIYNDKAYLFSAPSGTGKTTHTNFWVEKYGVEILNGDVAMLALEDGEMVAYGLPWCGTSEKYSNKRIPLGGVIFLYRSETNRIRQLSSLEGITSLLARTLSTSFERTDVEQNLNTISNFAPYINFLRLDCTNSPEAAEVVKQYIDK